MSPIVCSTRVRLLYAEAWRSSPLQCLTAMALRLTPEVADPFAVLEHIANLIEASLGAARKELEAVGSLLSKNQQADTLEKCAQFAADTQVALYAQKDRREEMINGHGDSPKIKYIYTLSRQLSSAPTTVASMAFLKRPSPLDGSRSIADQIHMVNFPMTLTTDEESNDTITAASPIEVFQSLLHNALTPYFDAYTRSQNLTARQWHDSESKVWLARLEATGRRTEHEPVTIPIEY